MSGKWSRNKGASYERAVAKLFKFWGWPDAKRNLDQYQAVDGRDLKGTFPFVVQCKCGKAPSPWKAYQEARDSCTEDEIALAVVKRDNTEAVVIMSIADFGLLVGPRKLLDKAE